MTSLSSHTWLRGIDTLTFMPPTIKNLFQKNLLALLERQEKTTASQPKLANRGGIGQRTVGRALKSEVSPRLTTIEGLAKSFEVAPWQLLHPTLGEMPKTDHNDPFLYQLIDLYNQLDHDARHTLTAVANGFLANKTTAKTTAAPFNGVKLPTANTALEHREHTMPEKDRTKYAHTKK